VKNLRAITTGFFDTSSINKSVLTKSLSYGNESFNESVASSTLAVPEEEYVYQHALRPLFGKQGLNTNAVGPHPDFSDLTGGEVVHHYIATLFVDIKGSTRLNLITDDIKSAFLIKNRILQAAIDVVRSLDGHPHRLMGDALMAFFGGKGIKKEDAIANAINASAMIRLVMKESVFPYLDEHLKTNTNLAVRVGVDFGDSQEVLWARYGFAGANEVTAQGLRIDCAAKLQNNASSNQAMLGDNLLDFIDFPSIFREIKTKKRKDKLEQVPYMLPNITDIESNQINYPMYHLHSSGYSRLLPIPTSWKAELSDISGVTHHGAVNYLCMVEEDGAWNEYKSASRFLSSGLNLKFKIRVTRDLASRYGGLEVTFTKQNHGSEAGNEVDPVSVERKIWRPTSRSNDSFLECAIPEATSYRGLHTMKVTVRPKNNLSVVLFQDWIGVYILGKSGGR
jgi:Adenylate cyclase, family 3 (some proteins contain HAMP domain)